MKALTPGQGVTIYHVAERAGVSIATVSRVLRGNVPVSAETARRVREAIAELRYTPSRLGRGLAERQHAANGIVFPELSGPYYAEVVLGYESVVAELGRSVLILSSHGRSDAPGMVRELAGRVDGLVLCTRTVDDEVIVEIAASGVPVVLIARTPVVARAGSASRTGAMTPAGAEDPAATADPAEADPAEADPAGVADPARLIDTINAENRASARDLARHLLGHGYRRFLFLGDTTASFDFAERWMGVREVLGDVPRVPCAFDEEGGRAAADVVRAHAPDAVICGNDEIALGLAEATGGSVPITGWDDVMAARYAGLTTVRQPMRELGARAARLLDERITGARSRPRHEVLPTRLVIRSSCGPHPEEGSR
ncbi:LacI family DNA-binding transcriptional regulator [Thermopolyspora sp. NPDC052614]|uniref:LacI family DNA-binding transcriptional regulator n=1 Tax=Thermopolyspora sp. NPDC052614 TaxID=3155682 RepID=UPI0034280844